MRKLLALVAFCLFVLSLSASVEVGKTYRVVSKKYPTKSLFVKNSSYDIGSEVMLWEETDVPSQQWTILETSTGLPVLQNVYSGYYATPRTQKLNSTLRINRVLNNSGVILEPSGEDENAYHIMSRDSAYYLTTSKGTDGEEPAWGEKEEANDGQLWLLQEVEPKSKFSPEMRDEMINGWLSHFAVSKGSSSRTLCYGSWGESEQLEVVLDAYESTGDESYLNMAKWIYNYFNNNVGSSWNKLVYTDAYKWYGHDFNDDVMWQIIAVARLGWLTGSKAYTNAAKKNFDIIYDRAYIPFTGLMRWAENSGDRYGTNSCIAGPTEVAACYLGMSGCGEVYFEKARDLYAAQRKILANNMSSGKIWDSVVWDSATETVKSKNEWASTYNQGTMLGAACLLYDHYGDVQYYNDARKIMLYTKSNLCNSRGVVSVCQNIDGDLCGFKGILMRYVRRFILDLCQPDYQEWMTKNAMHAYCNRSSEKITSSAWLTKSTKETTKNAFSCSTAASAAANTPLWDVVKNGFDTLQVERFDYHCGLFTNKEEDCGMGGSVYVSNGFWAQYDNVDFGEETALSMSLDVTAPSTGEGTVEVYFDKMDDTPAGVIDMSDIDASKTWHTLFCDITPTTGMHRVYLRFTCSRTRAKVYRADQFRFFTQEASALRTRIDKQPTTDSTQLPDDAPLYDLSGRRTLHPSQGIYILGRKKVLMK
ncbi:MAG: carbohydrate-binding protein [Bacteroidaceae bacterium]|nr:carbohydrate-binding protein [Bacteroidaceae bacterium]